jgi:hypothetical protein
LDVREEVGADEGARVGIAVGLSEGTIVDSLVGMEEGDEELGAADGDPVG